MNRFGIGSFLFALVFVLIACSSGNEPTGNKVGEGCEMTRDCETGLVCYKGEAYTGGFCTIMCDPSQIEGNISTDCYNEDVERFLGINNVQSRCAFGKPDEELGICRPSCEGDKECKREGYRCYAYDYKLIKSFRGGFCTEGGKVGAKCETDRDCALDLTCYRDQTWECKADGDCPGTQVCDTGDGLCARQPEGFCTKPCRHLSEEEDMDKNIQDPLWLEVYPEWDKLSTGDKKKKAEEYQGESPECPEDSVCGPKDLCRPACSGDSNCYVNRFDVTCDTDKDCEPGGYCSDNENVCKPNCLKDNTCAGLDYECRDWEGITLCLPVIHCKSDENCDSDEFCNTAESEYLCQPKSETE
ncbi:MAG: hypothetical protein PHQ00_07255 [Phycisphaerae bacterium]|nr:hypothetical protein [Phycisphaerae bacterium]